MVRSKQGNKGRKIPWKQIYKQYQTKEKKRKRSSYSTNSLYKCQKTKKMDINAMEPDNNSNINIIVNCEILKNLIESFMKCHICDIDIVFSIDVTKRMRLCNTIDMKCSDCNWKYSIETYYQSSKLNSNNGRKSYDINIQSVIAFREMGKGPEGISSFRRKMNMSPPLAKKSYNRINYVLHQVYYEAASNSMLDAANETHTLVKESQDVVVDS